MPSPFTPTLNPPHDNMGRKPRTIVLLFDSPGKFSLANSNVHKLNTLLDKSNYGDQVCYYHPGAGAREFEPSLLRPFTRWAWPLLDHAFAWYLSEQVQGGYKFLMETYENGDKICLFGFARGAYVARALAGMLHKIGLLPKGGMKVSSAYKHFKSTGPKNEILVEAFKEMHCHDVPVDFIGVWDTPTSVGFVVPQSLPPACVEVNTTTRVFRQALSLDEQCIRLYPNLCYHNPPGQSSKASDSYVLRHGMFKTDTKEVWFPGSHSDVGGGATLTRAKHALSNISLRWMVEQIRLADCGIIFNIKALDQRHIPHALGQGTATSEDGSVEDLDRQDAVLEITDELWKAPLWWVFEILPSSYIYKGKKGEWVTTWWPHLGRGRLVPPNPLFHTSVKFRMDKINYEPKAHYKKGTETYGS